MWIVFLKQMQLDGVLKRCAHLFNEKQIVFSAMNGYGHFEKLNEYFSTDRIYGGTALIGAYVRPRRFQLHRRSTCQGHEPVCLRG